jgi:CheY-like chemotaxis protein/anti-sigma regulatory factor (Ser/Thr protein kinase)
LAIGGMLRDQIQSLLADHPEVTAVFDLEEPLMLVFADPPQLTTALSHIVRNAIESMPRGGRLRVKAENCTLVPHEHATLPAGAYVRIQLSDEGVGMDPTNLAKALDPFYSTKPTHSGLGLTIAYGIVDKHEGALTLDLNEAKGVTVTLHLPVHQNEATGVAVAPPTLGEPVIKKILMMDDDPLIREILTEMLAAWDIETTAVAEGQEALACYRQAMDDQRPFPMVILDWSVPQGWGGKETVAALLSLDPGARVVVSSGYSTEGALADYQRYGFCDVLSKPYRMNDLKALLEKHGF